MFRGIKVFIVCAFKYYFFDMKKILLILSIISFLFSAKVHASAFDEHFSFLVNADDIDYIGEAVSQKQHALQAAFHAERSGADEATIIAALLHDVGHLIPGADTADMEGCGACNHEKTGADYLRKIGLPEKVAILVEGHVEAKRYRVYKYPDYYETISPASKTTFKYQNGIMTDEEAHAFEQDPYFEGKMNIRIWDEQAKNPDAVVPGFDHYEGMFLRCLAGTHA